MHNDSEKDIVNKSLPFEKSLFHDHWIAIIASLNGKIEFIDKPLIRYRQHSFNQTGVFKGVHNKNAYFKLKLQEPIEDYNTLKQRFDYNHKIQEYIENCLTWFEARAHYFFKPNIKDLKIIFKYKKFNKVSTIIESILPFMPDMVFKLIIKLVKKGIL